MTIKEERTPKKITTIKIRRGRGMLNDNVNAKFFPQLKTCIPFFRKMVLIMLPSPLVAKKDELEVAIRKIEDLQK